jgi:3'-5' exoribonuclease
VKDLRVGSSVDTTFLVMEKELKEFVTKEGYYLQVKLGDGTGSIWAKCWERAEEAASLFEAGDIIRVKGAVESFRGKLQLIFNLEGIERSTELFDVAEYLPRTQKNRNVLWDELITTAESIENEYLKRLVLLFLNDSDFIEGFKNAPAAKIHHHNYIGGLLEHTHSVVLLCKTISGLYPELDRDLLLTGAILHDIGKLLAYNYGTTIDVTEAGGLLDHIVLGYRMVEERIKSIEGFPEELELRVLHLILSHHNYGEWGSPVRPLFAEAEALFLADMVDAQLMEFRQIQRYEEAKGEDGIWSGYSKRLDRFFYLGRRETYPKEEKRKK